MFSRTMCELRIQDLYSWQLFARQNCKSRKAVRGFDREEVTATGGEARNACEPGEGYAQIQQE